jgi:hypothetical protein
MWCEFREVRHSDGHTVLEKVNSYLPRNFYVSWPIWVKFGTNDHHALPFSDCDFHFKKLSEAMSENLLIFVHFFPRPIRIKFGIDDFHTIPLNFYKFHVEILFLIFVKIVSSEKRTLLDIFALSFGRLIV